MGEGMGNEDNEVKFVKMEIEKDVLSDIRMEIFGRQLEEQVWSSREIWVGDLLYYQCMNDSRIYNFKEVIQGKFIE